MCGLIASIPRLGTQGPCRFHSEMTGSSRCDGKGFTDSENTSRHLQLDVIDSPTIYVEFMGEATLPRPQIEMGRRYGKAYLLGVIKGRMWPRLSGNDTSPPMQRESNGGVDRRLVAEFDSRAFNSDQSAKSFSSTLQAKYALYQSMKRPTPSSIDTLGCTPVQASRLRVSA
jgi:hypothetical protein